MPKQTWNQSISAKKSPSYLLDLGKIKPLYVGQFKQPLVLAKLKSRLKWARRNSISRCPIWPLVLAQHWANTGLESPISPVKVDSPRPSAETFLPYIEKKIVSAPGRGRSKGGFSAPERRNFSPLHRRPSHPVVHQMSLHPDYHQWATGGPPDVATSSGPPDVALAVGTRMSACGCNADADIKWPTGCTHPVVHPMCTHAVVHRMRTSTGHEQDVRWLKLASWRCFDFSQWFFIPANFWQNVALRPVQNYIAAGGFLTYFSRSRVPNLIIIVFIFYWLIYL